MGRLIYSAITSLDGYIVDASGNFDWAMPDEEVHAFVNDQERPVGTYLYGRRMYEIMTFWETVDVSDEPAVMTDYADIWRSADKLVYSATLAEVTTARTRLERTFDAGAVRSLVAAAPTDVSIGGATLAGAALRAGIVDDIRLIAFPVLVGGGTRALPDGVRIDLDLVAEHRFGNGAVATAYTVTR